jgi:hypothetical protein
MPRTSIEIVGDAECHADVSAAIELLKTRDPVNHTMALGVIGIIECVEQGSGMAAYEHPPRFKVGDRTREASTTWLAGAIVHDATHSKLYDDYASAHWGFVPRSAWTGEQAESTCIDAQIQTLQTIGAPQNETSQAQSALSKSYWEVPQPERSW